MEALKVKLIVDSPPHTWSHGMTGKEFDVYERGDEDVYYLKADIDKQGPFRRLLCKSECEIIKSIPV